MTTVTRPHNTPEVRLPAAPLIRRGDPMSKTAAPFRLIPDSNGLIHLAAAYTPSTHIHAPDSDFVRWYWLADLGPSAYLAWTTLALWLPTAEGSTVPLDYTELAHSLGTAPDRLTRALARLAAFYLAHTLSDQPHTLHIRRAAPDLSSGQRARLAQRCPTLAAELDVSLATVDQWRRQAITQGRIRR